VARVSRPQRSQPFFLRDHGKALKRCAIAPSPVECQVCGQAAGVLRRSRPRDDWAGRRSTLGVQRILPLLRPQRFHYLHTNPKLRLHPLDDAVQSRGEFRSQAGAVGAVLADRLQSQIDPHRERERGEPRDIDDDIRESWLGGERITGESWQGGCWWRRRDKRRGDGKRAVCRAEGSRLARPGGLQDAPGVRWWRGVAPLAGVVVWRRGVIPRALLNARVCVGGIPPLDGRLLQWGHDRGEYVCSASRLVPGEYVCSASRLVPGRLNGRHRA
jgi:hypothetical protein